MRKSIAIVACAALAVAFTSAVIWLRRDPTSDALSTQQLASQPAMPAGRSSEPVGQTRPETPVQDSRITDPHAIIAANDINGDGVVTREEADKSGKRLARLWSIYDLNRDGKVRAVEIERLNASIAARPASMPDIDAIIVANDRNGDGIVTRAEAAQTNGDLDRRWDSYDLNKDGKIDRLE